jgi:hypothetical protein
MVTVESSDLAAVDYWNGTLTIAFHSDGVYEYYDVPYSEYAGLLQASSHGKYFQTNIKGRYSYKRIA